MGSRPTEQDPLIAALLKAEREGQTTQPYLEAILSKVAPRLKRFRDRAVERRLLPTTEAGDLINEVNLRLLTRLQRLQDDPAAEPLGNLDDYLGTVLRHTLQDLGRRVNPVIARLTLRVRYVLTHTRTLAMWGKNPVLCGLETWSGRMDSVPPPSLAGLPSGADSEAHTLRAVIVEILRRAQGPLELDTLIEAVAATSGTDAHQLVPLDWARSLAAEDEEAVEPVVTRQYLELVWEEIEQLPLRQRRALLLNLRLDSGDSIVRSLAALRIASLRRLANVLEISVEELLAQWDRLPLSDSELSESLGLTRQQVVNLRKAARDRLARRTGRPRSGATR